MPVIADAYYKGIRDYDVNALYDAMKTSAKIDTFGYWVRDYRGTINYLKYEYVPCDKELSSVSKTLEYAYDDWCIAQMAKMLGRKQDYDYFIKRAGFYKNVFDSQSNMFRGRLSDLSWRTPFNRFYCDHYHSQLDDFAEATAWVYAFSAQHDGKGLVNLMGREGGFLCKIRLTFHTKDRSRFG